MAYKEGLYWREPQDELMKIILTKDNNSKEWYNAYNKLLPRLKLMSIKILRRYYGRVDDKKSEDYVTDAITHLIINGNYNPDKPKMYAYCGTIIKRYFYDMFVIKPDDNIDDNYDINENEWVVNSHYHEPDFDEFDLTERQDILNKIIMIIDDGLSKCDEKLNKKRKIPVMNIGSIREKNFLIYAKEYFLKYFMETSISAISLGEYIQIRTDLKDYVLSEFMRKYFNLGAQPRLMETRDRRVDDWTKKRNSSYIMDDYTPNDIISSNYKYHGLNKIKKDKKDFGFEYF